MDQPDVAVSFNEMLHKFGDVMVIKILNDQPESVEAAMIMGQTFSEKCPHYTTIIVPHGMDLEQLDEKSMEKFGWVRKRPVNFREFF